MNEDAIEMMFERLKDRIENIEKAMKDSQVAFHKSYHDTINTRIKALFNVLGMNLNDTESPRLTKIDQLLDDKVRHFGKICPACTEEWKKRGEKDKLSTQKNCLQAEVSAGLTDSKPPSNYNEIMKNYGGDVHITVEDKLPQAEYSNPSNKCKDCDTYGEMHGTREPMCFHESIRPKAYEITPDYICPKENPSEQEIGVVMATGKVQEPTELNEKANIEQIIEIYDNGHESVFYPDTHKVVSNEALEFLFSWADFGILTENFSGHPGIREKYLKIKKEINEV